MDVEEDVTPQSGLSLDSRQVEKTSQEKGKGSQPEASFEEEESVENDGSQTMELDSEPPKMVIGEDSANVASSSSSDEAPPTLADGSVLMFWFDACEGECFFSFNSFMKR
jgi:hypothetical protein